jgi:aldehyde:ferredoxin oxidoreductase
MPAWDPRPLKAAGVTYCTSPQGADHTAGLVIDPVITGPDAAKASQEIQIIIGVCDSSGFCMFLGPTLDETRKFYSLFLGRDVTRDEIANLGWQCLADEWAFNDRAGFTAKDDDIAACLRDEGIGPDKSMKFDIPIEVAALARVRQPAQESLYTKSPAG